MDNKVEHQTQCQVCHKKFASENSLHKHIKAHGLLLAAYYQQTYPKYDKYDGQIIKFRNKAQYLTTDFNQRENLRLWMDKIDKPTARAYARSLLEARRDAKKIVWVPFQVELRTTMLPPIQTYNELFGNYDSLCQELGLKARFRAGGLFEGGFGPISKIPIYTIYIDTREQKPFYFPNYPTENRALKYGDYACSPNWNTCNLVIERKSAKDFCGTFSGGFARFCREVDRAKAAGAYLVVLVEDSLNRMLKFDYQSYVFHAHGITPEFIFHNVREILQSYENVQFLFVEDRSRAQEMVVKLFDSGCSYKTVDLQLQYDKGMI